MDLEEELGGRELTRQPGSPVGSAGERGLGGERNVTKCLKALAGLRPCPGWQRLPGSSFSKMP